MGDAWLDEGLVVVCERIDRALENNIGGELPECFLLAPGTQ